MAPKPLRILIMEPDQSGQPVFKTLSNAGRLDVSAATDFQDAGSRLARDKMDAVIIDMGERDNASLHALAHAYTRPPQPPVLIRIDHDAERTTIQEVAAYLIRGPIDADMVDRAVRFAMSRNRVQEENRKTEALTDKISGLYNKTGFMEMAEHLLKLAKRSDRGTFLFIVKLNNYRGLIGDDGLRSEVSLMKRIVDIFHKTFRESDVIARTEPDEFRVLALEATQEDSIRIRERFNTVLMTFNTRHPNAAVTITTGSAWFNPNHPVTLMQLTAEARASMS